MAQREPLPSEQVSEYLERVKQGDSLAAHKIFAHYESQLLRHARRRLSDKLRIADEEDIVVMAFQSFFRGVREEKFQKLDNRDDLWQLLSMLATRKAIDAWQREQRQKRGGGKLLGESALDDDNGRPGLPQQISDEPPPDLALEMIEQVDHLLEILDDDILRQVALCKLAGHGNQEIAERIGSGLRTVERKLTLIRTVWRAHEIA